MPCRSFISFAGAAIGGSKRAVSNLMVVRRLDHSNMTKRAGSPLPRGRGSPQSDGVTAW